MLGLSSQQIAYRIVKDSIIKCDIDLMRTKMRLFNPYVDQMDYDVYNNILVSFLNIAVKNCSEAVKKDMFLAIIDVFNTEDDFLPIRSRIWIIKRSSFEVLEYMKIAFNDAIDTYLLDFASYETFPQDKDSIISIDTAISRLTTVYGDPTGDQLINMRQILLSKQNNNEFINNTVFNYVDAALASYYGQENIKIADIPDYIEDFEYGTDNNQLISDAFSLLESTNILTPNGYKLAKELALDIETISKALGTDPIIALKDGLDMNMKDFLFRSMIILTPMELKESLNIKSSCVDKSVFTDIFDPDPDEIEELEEFAQIFIRILGPSNPFGDINVEDREDEPPNPFDRMFTCTCYNNALAEDDGDRQEDEPIDIFNWFTGICEQCSYMIIKPWYAVRAPVLPGGGWAGCYCSWNCVRDSMTNITPDMEMFINRFENQMNTYKIHDRDWSNN